MDLPWKEAELRRSEPRNKAEQTKISTEVFSTYRYGGAWLESSFLLFRMEISRLSRALAGVHCVWNHAGIMAVEHGGISSPNQDKAIKAQAEGRILKKVPSQDGTLLHC